MRMGPDLLGLSSKKPALAVPTPKPARKPQEILASTRRIQRKIGKQRLVRFEGVPVEKGAEEVATRVSSRGRIIRTGRKL